MRTCGLVDTNIPGETAESVFRVYKGSGFFRILAKLVPGYTALIQEFGNLKLYIN
jgi:hypothetical protein